MKTVFVCVAMLMSVPLAAAAQTPTPPVPRVVVVPPAAPVVRPVVRPPIVDRFELDNALREVRANVDALQVEAFAQVDVESMKEHAAQMKEQAAQMKEKAEVMKERAMEMAKPFEN